MVEEWRPVVGWEGVYQVSSHGRIRREGAGRVLKPWTQNGYLKVTLSGANSRKHEHIARLVLRAFEGAPPPGKEMALHGDGDPQNNYRINLRWGSPSDNMQDALRHGTHPKASRTTCKRGHEYSDENTTFRPDRPDTRVCRTCTQEQERTRARRRRGSEPPTHGTPNAYSSYKCRCLICKTAYAQYQKERRSHDKS